MDCLVQHLKTRWSCSEGLTSVTHAVRAITTGYSSIRADKAHKDCLVQHLKTRWSCSGGSTSVIHAVRGITTGYSSIRTDKAHKD